MTAAALSPSELLLQQCAGLMYERVPPSMTVTHPGPAPTIGLNLGFSLLHWGGVVTATPPSRPFSISKTPAPTEHRGFWNFRQPLPSWATAQPTSASSASTGTGG